MTPKDDELVPCVECHRPLELGMDAHRQCLRDAAFKLGAMAGHRSNPGVNPFQDPLLNESWERGKQAGQKDLDDSDKDYRDTLDSIRGSWR